MAPDPGSAGEKSLWGKVWGGILTFLEIIGLKSPPPPDQTIHLARFKLLHTEFRKLLSANNSFLETLAEVDVSCLKGARMDQDFIRRKAIRAAADIHGMVESLQAISGGRFSKLPVAYDRITAELTGRLQVQPGLSEALVLDLPEIRASHADLVGGKIANLAELANILRLPTPNGFAVTTEAYRVFLEDGGLRSWLQSCLLELSCSGDPKEWAETIQDGLLQTELPPRLAEAFTEAVDRWEARADPDRTLAVRSSAIGEDGRLSYAGQFLTILNVSRNNLAEAYIKVAASLFAPEAVHYRSLHGVAHEGVEIAVAVLGLIDAKASGVVFSKDPSRPDSGQVLIQAVRGLGVSLVEGRVSAETILVNTVGFHIKRTSSSQTAQIVPSSEGGLIERTLDPTEAAQAIITDEEASCLAGWVLKAEAHFGTPQDMEWAMDAGRRLFVVQTRPLKLTGGAGRDVPPLAGHTILLAGGETACPGVGSGPVVHLSEEDDLESFPPGGILVARRPSPKFIRVMEKAKAIVTDFGSTTGHMASLARELRIPALLNTKIAVESIPSGTIVTVDAANGYVYAGKVMADPPEENGREEIGHEPIPPELTPEGRYQAQVMELVAPLWLIDPRSPDFNADQARTLHDLARYIHEKSYEVMFGLGAGLGDLRPSSYLLDVFLPIDLYIIDIGGGLAQTPANRKVKRAHIASIPMSAVLDGMLDKRLPRFGAKPMDIKGFFSVMMRHATENPEEDQSFKDPSYALISLDYLNLTARVGYHFSVVDSYCGITPNKNYISLLFRGGAANAIRRHRRVKAIAAVLDKQGFAVKVDRDSVHARLSKAPRVEIIAHLTMIGRLFQFFRQLDAAMTGEDAVRRISEAFLNEEYDLSLII